MSTFVLWGLGDLVEELCGGCIEREVRREVEGVKQGSA
jgi:hypothetical protein